MGNKMGSYAFLAGAIIALVAGLFSGMVAGLAGWILLVLIVLGLVVGVLNVSDKEISQFLLAAAALMLVGSAKLTVIDSVLPSVGTILDKVVANLVVFVAPAALIVALKAIYGLAKDS